MRMRKEKKVEISRTQKQSLLVFVLHCFRNFLIHTHTHIDNEKTIIKTLLLNTAM